MLFLVGISLVQLLWVALSQPERSFRDFGRFCLGLAPMLALIVAFKLILAPSNDVVSDHSLWAQAMAPERYMQIATGFFQHARSFGDAWDGGIHPFVITAVYLVLFPPQLRRITLTSATLLLVPVWMVLGYFAVYVITPNDLSWHMNTSLSRLFLQIWPMSLFIVTSQSTGAV